MRKYSNNCMCVPSDWHGFFEAVAAVISGSQFLAKSDGIYKDIHA